MCDKRGNEGVIKDKDSMIVWEEEDGRRKSVRGYKGYKDL